MFSPEMLETLGTICTVAIDIAGAAMFATGVFWIVDKADGTPKKRYSTSGRRVRRVR